MPTQGSTQPPLRQARPCGHAMSVQASTQSPAAQTLPSGHSTSLQAGSMHRPSAVQVAPSLQRNSPVPHFGTQAPRLHTSPMGHRLSPLSTVPSQSSSSALHISGIASSVSTQVMTLFLHCNTPAAHTPILPVSHGCPPPPHCTPDTENKKSSKSLSPP